MAPLARLILPLMAIAVGACSTTTTVGETQLTNAELRQLLVGKSAVLSGQGGGTAIYSEDGSYEYRGRGTSRGTYTFRNDQVCVRFLTGQSRCDRYLRTGDGYVLVNRQGARFDVRIRS